MALGNNSEGSGSGQGAEDGEYEDDGNFSSLPAAWEITLFIVTALLIIVVNMFVVLLITRKSSLRTASNLIFVSLAVSDLLMGALGVPLVFAASMDLPDEVLISSALFIKFISFSTMAHILLHTCDRYVYILRALRYEQLLHPRRIYTLLAVTWITTLFASSVRLVWLIGVDFDDDDAEDAMMQKEDNYNICSFTLFFCLPLAVITSVDIHMLCIVHKQSKLISQQNLPSELRKQSTKLLIARKRKAVFTCIIILIVYVLCWLPYFVLAWLQDDFVEPWLLWLIYYIRFISSVCNPWLYTLRKPDLRKAALRWNRKIFPCLRNRNRRQQRNRNSRLVDTVRTGLIDETSPV